MRSIEVLLTELDPSSFMTVSVCEVMTNGGFRLQMITEQSINLNVIFCCHSDIFFLLNDAIKHGGDVQNQLVSGS